MKPRLHSWDCHQRKFPVLRQRRLNYWTRPSFYPIPGAPGLDSGFLPNPHSLMVYNANSQSIGQQSDRMQGNIFSSGQNSHDGKDIVSAPYSGSSFQMYPSQADPFPPPLYTPMGPPLLRPNPDRSVGLISPGGGGAFRPVSSEESDTHLSAFLPTKHPSAGDRTQPGLPNSDTINGEHEKRSDNVSIDSQPGVLRDDWAVQSSPPRPASHCSSASDVHSEGADCADRINPDEGRNLRRSRKRTHDSENLCCPVCGVTLRPGEINSHLATEVERLDKLSARGSRKSYSKEPTPAGKKNVSSQCSSKKAKDPTSTEVVDQNRYETYLRIKGNRQNRLTAKGKGKGKKRGEETQCPVCNDKITGTSEELNQHVENCLSKKRVEEDDEDDIDIEGEFEEYEWAGQTRVRVSTMLPGGLAASGFKCIDKTEEEDADLDVDGDDEKDYGQTQYSEADIIPCTSDEPGEDKERKALRDAFIKSRGEKKPPRRLPNDRKRWQKQAEQGTSRERSSSTTEEDSEVPSPSFISSDEVIESLKAKIREQESELSKKDHVKCLICMECYHKPLVSIQCWHVHCEECWLRTLGAKKLCPQCNMITSASDLRRLFL